MHRSLALLAVLFGVWLGGAGLARASDIAAGQYHTFSILPDATATCWGANGFGQLGVENDLSLHPLSERVLGLGDVAGLTAGSLHSCANLTDGSAACWGYNVSGQLGLGDERHRQTPVLLPSLSGVTLIEAGTSHTCALVAGGQVTCWGSNSWGELGLGDTEARSLPHFVPGLFNATALAAGGGFTCALRSNGSVACWGRNTVGQLGLGDSVPDHFSTPQDVPDLTQVEVLTAGSEHVCAGFEDGSIACWGLGRWGRLGLGDTEDRYSPEAVPGLDDVIALAAGDSHTCALELDGRLSCWGNNTNGQLGMGDREQRQLPGLVLEFDEIVSIANGPFHGCARRVDSDLFCWGSNRYAQLGPGGILGDVLSPQRVSFEHLWRIFGDDFETGASLLDGSK